MKVKNITNGVGIRDVPQDNNCIFQQKWKGMVNRCYSPKAQIKRPTYVGKSVCEDWLLFSNFKYWMTNQAYLGLELDKDILIKGNDVYSPETCVFVPRKLNNLLHVKGKENNLPIGVCMSRNGDKFRARYFCQGKDIHLGIFTDSTTAHKAWQLAKAGEIERTVSWYATQECFRTDVASSLMKRAWDLMLDDANGVETFCI